MSNKPAALYHGTSHKAAEAIVSEGLRGGLDRHIWLTDSLIQAQRRAMWAELIEIKKVREPFGNIAFASALSRAAGQKLEPVVLSVNARGLELAHHADLCPPLPWETTVVDHFDAWSTSKPIPAAKVSVVGVVDMTGVKIPTRATLVRELREHGRNWSNPGMSGCPPVPIGPFACAVPEIFDALGASLAAIDDQERSHRWRGVAGAGYRLIEAGAQADAAVVFAYSILYDHGERAPELATKMHRERLLIFSDDQVALLAAALAGRDREETSDDPTIGVCWDADRLTRPPAPGPHSTPEAGTAEVPDQDDTNWLWIRNRFNHAR
jgi:hypothetical protein